MWLRHGTSMCGNTLKTGMTSLSGSKSLRRVWAALFAQLLGWWNHPGVSSELVERFLIWLGFVHQRFFDQISAHYLPVLGIQGIGQVPIFATTWTNFPAPTGNVQIDGKHRSFDRWKTGSLELFLVEFGLQKDLSTRHVIVLVLWFCFSGSSCRSIQGCPEQDIKREPLSRGRSICTLDWKTCRQIKVNYSFTGPSANSYPRKTFGQGKDEAEETEGMPWGIRPEAHCCMAAPWQQNKKSQGLSLNGVMLDLCIGFCCICEFWKHLRADCESMSLYQDASCGLLLMRFGSCDEHLQSRKGMMGVFHLASLRQSHALMIKQATQKIIQMFCSPGCTMPYSKVQRFLGIGIFLVQWMKNPRNRMLTHDI